MIEHFTNVTVLYRNWQTKFPQCVSLAFESLLPEALGLRVLSLPLPSVRPSVRHQVCPRDNSSPVQARITKLGPKMQNTLVKVPMVLGGNQPWPSRSYLRSNRNLPHFELVRTITHHSFKLGSPNLDQRCKIHWLRSLVIWVAIDHDLQGQIWLKKSNFLASPLLEIHNHHITTREPWLPRLLHRPDCFMVFILCMYLYTYTVSWSWLFHSLNTLHVHWSWQPRVFRRLTPFL